ncbi:MAG: DUF4340 domain-containing protein [Bacteroidia bacterium]|nr:DUF4340 domain-containing protein [Bacteroidia bacterium]
MKKNLIYLAILIVLSGIAYFLYTKNQKTGSFSATDFAISDTSSITKIFLADKKGNKVTLFRKSPTEWMVENKYTVRADAMNTLLKTIRLVEVKNPVPKKSHNNIVKDMAARAVKIEIYTQDEDEPALVYYVGGAAHDDLGSYMIKEGDETPFICYIPGFNGYLSTRYMTRMKDWRDTEIFRYNTIKDIKSVSVEYPQKPDNSFQIDILSTNSFAIKAMQSGKNLAIVDTLALKDYLTGWKFINFEAFDYPEAKIKDSIVSSSPLAIYRMVKSDGKKVELRSYLKRPGQNMPSYNKEVMYDVDRMYGKLSNEDDLVIIQYFVFDKLTVPLSYFSGAKTP